MRRLVVLFSLFLLTGAERQDLSGKMFTFPVQSSTHHVLLSPEMDKNFTTVSMCLRVFSDISRTLFSISLPSYFDGFSIYKPSQGVFNFYVLGEGVSFMGLKDAFNAWDSVCATWDGNTGLAQIWVNGSPSSRRGLKQGGSLTGIPKIILGQEQDSYGGGFDAAQSFVGMLTDVHIWDSVLSPDQIAYYSYGGQLKPGNIINWNSLEFGINGYVVVESKETSNKAGGV